MDQTALQNEPLSLLALLEPAIERAQHAALQLLLVGVLVAQNVHVLQHQLRVVVEFEVVVVAQRVVPAYIRARARSTLHPSPRRYGSGGLSAGGSTERGNGETYLGTGSGRNGTSRGRARGEAGSSGCSARRRRARACRRSWRCF